MRNLVRALFRRRRAAGGVIWPSQVKQGDVAFMISDGHVWTREIDGSWVERDPSNKLLRRINE